MGPLAAQFHRDTVSPHRNGKSSSMQQSPCWEADIWVCVFTALDFPVIFDG
jgi:hypothetical protein